ncbi:DUF748 domain-containing protein [Halieaceae bacterium IMCC14734]|uniref:DUF748 domain-containing protein n=1 Tax=Candidatus Litorirhabdus singularis TaxID=2518993 RepID=A0ABT3TG70_9GAMM|nr:DUF748 domain-containing protein [Candidatus Litorirhabdus singularis]MCX2981264.1 DUF748 domain-containing protein [Candidatus Litorirhabdus singularis]
MISPVFKQRWLVILTVCALLLALFVSVLPLLTRYLLIKNVDQSLAVKSQLENLDINLFTGRVSAEGLQVAGHASSSLSGASLFVDIAMLELLRGNIVVESVNASGLFLRIEEDERGNVILVIPLGGETEAESAGDLVLPLFTLHSLTIENSEVELDAFGLQATAAIDLLTVSALSTAEIAPSSLSLQMRWNDASVEVDGTISPFAESPELALAVDIEQLNLADFAGQLPSSVTDLAGILKLNGRIDGTIDALTSSFDLQLQELGATSGHFATRIPNATWSGDIGVSNALANPQVSVRGDLTVAELQVDDTRQSLRVLQWKHLRVAGLELDADAAVEIETIELLELKTVVTDDDSSPAAAGSITVQELALADDRLVISSLTSSALTSRIVVTPAGDLQSQGLIMGIIDSLDESFIVDTESVADAGADGGQSKATPAAVNEFSWQIKQSEFTASSIEFSDQKFTHPMNITLLVDKLSLGNLDSSAAADPTEMNLVARVGEYGRVDASGEIAPLAEAVYLDIQGNIESIRLPVLSPYIEDLLGYELVAGQYDHEFKARIADEKLTSENNMVLRKLKVKSAPNVKASAPLPMPLGLALDMLRDGKDNIKLKVPVSGRLDDPDIGVDQVISTALGKALMAGSTTYLKLALQPYGAIWMGAEMGLKAAGKMSLDPMIFTALSAEPSVDNLAYTEKLSVLLTERPSLELQVCGAAGRDDHQALLARIAATADGPATTDDPAISPPPVIDAAGTAELLELARLRQQRLKQLLVQQHGIEAKRVYTCKASVAAEGKLSGVSLGL